MHGSATADSVAKARERESGRTPHRFLRAGRRFPTAGALWETRSQVARMRRPLDSCLGCAANGDRQCRILVTFVNRPNAAQLEIWSAGRSSSWLVGGGGPK